MNGKNKKASVLGRIFSAALALGLTAGLFPLTPFVGSPLAPLTVNAAGEMTLRYSSGIGNYINFPASGEYTVDVSDKTDRFSFRIFDDGGSSGGYSPGCDSKLSFKAPDGFLMSVTGSMTASDQGEYLTIFDGSSASAPRVYMERGSSRIGNRILTSGSDLCINLITDSVGTESGLDLTVTLIDPNKARSISKSSVSHGSVSLSASSAKRGDTVNITASPDSGYALSDLTVLDEYGRSVKVSGGTWLNPYGSFIMPETDVIVRAAFTPDISSNGGIFLKIPQSGTETVTIPSGINTFRIYDDGGKSGEYSSGCSGQLVLQAPAGCLIEVFGKVCTEASTDYLKGTSKNPHIKRKKPPKVGDL